METTNMNRRAWLPLAMAVAGLGLGGCTNPQPPCDENGKYTAWIVACPRTSTSDPLPMERCVYVRREGPPLAGHHGWFATVSNLDLDDPGSFQEYWPMSTTLGRVTDPIGLRDPGSGLNTVVVWHGVVTSDNRITCEGPWEFRFDMTTETPTQISEARYQGLSGGTIQRSLFTGADDLSRVTQVLGLNGVRVSGLEGFVTVEVFLRNKQKYALRLLAGDVQGGYTMVTTMPNGQDLGTSVPDTATGRDFVWSEGGTSSGGSATRGTFRAAPSGARAGLAGTRDLGFFFSVRDDQGVSQVSGFSIPAAVHSVLWSSPPDGTRTLLPKRGMDLKLPKNWCYYDATMTAPPYGWTFKRADDAASDQVVACQP